MKDKVSVLVNPHGFNVHTIHCSYIVHGTRNDLDPMIVEYEGETPADYPGNNNQYSIAGYHYDKRTI